MGVRSGMLELAILGELEDPLHGYELRKRLSRTLGPVRRLSFGSLYPALHRLADQGLIEVVGTANDQDTPTKSRTSRSVGSKRVTAKKNAASAKHTASAKRAGKVPAKDSRQVTYKVTAAGQEHLRASLSEADVDDDSMPFTVGLMSRATPATRLTLLMQRRSQVLARQQASEAAKASSDFWVRSRGELDAQQAQSELSWIDRLIQSDQQLVDGPANPTSSNIDNTVKTEGQ